MQQPFVKGDLVQLLDLKGIVHEKTLGTVTGIHPKNGRLLIHWWTGVQLDDPGLSTFEWGRIIHAKRAV